MTNEEIITSIHTALISKPDLPIEAQKAHIFPGVNKALLSIGTLCDHGCQAVIDEKEVLILNKKNGKMMMKIRCDALSNPYMLNFTQRNNLMTEFRNPDVFLSGNIYGRKSKSTFVDYYHIS